MKHTLKQIQYRFALIYETLGIMVYFLRKTSVQCPVFKCTACHWGIKHFKTGDCMTATVRMVERWLTGSSSRILPAVCLRRCCCLAACRSCDVRAVHSQPSWILSDSNRSQKSKGSRKKSSSTRDSTNSLRILGPDQ